MTAVKMAQLRARAEEHRLLALQARRVVAERDRLALELVAEGHTWREVAEAAGFANPYIGQLKRKQQASEQP